MSLTTDSVPLQLGETTWATSTPVSASRTIYDSAGRVVGTERLKDAVVRVVDSATEPPNTTTWANYHSLKSEVQSQGTVLSSTKTEYDSAGRAARTRDANGLWSETFYGFASEVVQTRSQAKAEDGSIVWMISRTAYDQMGRAIFTTDSHLESEPSNYGTRTFYDGQGRSDKVERRSGVKLTLLDRHGAIVRDTSTAQGPFSIRIDDQGVDSQGNINLISRSQSFYNQKGQLVKSVSGIGPGREGVETRYEYDSRGRQIRQIGAPVQTIESNDPLRLVSETSYDSQGRAFKTTTNIRGRDVNGQILLDSTFAQSTEQVYDSLGRAYKTISPDGTSTQVTFDSWGQVIAETDQLSKSKLMEYDKNGRLKSVTLPAVADPLDSDGDGNSGLDAPRFDYAYDWAGNQTVLQDSLGRRTLFTYDNAGRQLTRTLPEGQTEQFTYNEFGQLKTHTSFEGVVTESIYDNGNTAVPETDTANYKVGTGRLIEQRYFANATAYNGGAGTPTETWKFSFDSFGRKVAAKLYLGNSTTAARSETWQYNDRGQMIQEAKPEGVINYEYDTVTGQKTRMTVAHVSNVANVIEDTRYTYNSFGWLTGVNVVEKNDVVLSEAVQEKTRYGHDLQGRALRMDMPNGVIQTTEVDSMGRVTKMRNYGPDSTPNNLSNNPLRSEFLYEMDLAGRRIQMREKFWLDEDNNPASAPVAKETVYDWFYDDNSRLTKEVIDSFDNTLDRTDTFTMDLFGNRLRKTSDLAATPGVIDEAIAYLFDSNDRLTSEKKFTGLANPLPSNWANGTANQTTSYTWTGTQQASKTVSVPSVSSVVQNFSYNLNGMLSSVVTETKNASNAVTGRTKVDYGYTSTGIRSIAVDWNDANLDGNYDPSEKSGSTEYLIDSGNFTGYAQTIAETTKNGAGQITKRIVYTFGTDEITQTTYDASSPTASSLFFGHDAHGSVRVLFDAATAIAQVYTYAAYGELLAVHNGFANLQPNASSLTSVLYNGESFDSRIGQLYLRARWYDMHRFTTLDPYAGNASDPLSFNKYGFVHGNPVMGTDPTGLATDPWVYKAVGTKVHHMFSVHAFAWGWTRNPGATLHTILPDQFSSSNPQGRLKPDITSIETREYFDLKPVTQFNDISELTFVQQQMRNYDNALRPIGYDRGESRSITLGLSRMPLGTIDYNNKSYLVELWPGRERLLDGSDGRGLVWYELTEITRQQKEQYNDQRLVNIPSALNIPQEVQDVITVFDYKVGDSGVIHTDHYTTGFAIAAIAVMRLSMLAYSYYAAARAATFTGNAIAGSIHASVGLATFNSRVA